MFQKNDSLNNFDYIFGSRDFFGFNMFINSINVLSQISENDLLYVVRLFSRCYNSEIIKDIPIVDTYTTWKGWYDFKEGSIKEL